MFTYCTSTYWTVIEKFPPCITSLTPNGSCSHPDRSAVTIQSEQKRCRHSLVVIVFFSMSKQMGHISSLCSERGDTATSVPSTMASCVHTNKILLCSVALHRNNQGKIQSQKTLWGKLVQFIQVDFLGPGLSKFNQFPVKTTYLHSQIQMLSEGIQFGTFHNVFIYLVKII